MPVFVGRYNSREPDYKRWKANFRCAVNSLQDVREVKEMRGTKAGDPYKVYKLLPAIPTKSKNADQMKFLILSQEQVFFNESFRYILCLCYILFFLKLFNATLNSFNRINIHLLENV